MLSELWFIYKDLYIWLGPGRNVQKMRMKPSWGWKQERLVFPFLSIFSIAARGQILVLFLAHVRFVICEMAMLPPRLLPVLFMAHPSILWDFSSPPGVSTYRQAGELELISHWGGVGLQFMWFDSKGSAVTYLSSSLLPSAFLTLPKCAVRAEVMYAPFGPGI